MFKKKKMKKTYIKAIFPALVAAMMVGSGVRTTSVQAQSNSSTPVFNLSSSSTSLVNDLKEEVIKGRAENDENINISSVNLEKSTIDISGLDRTSTALQNVTVKVTLYTENDSVSESTVGYSFTEDVLVRLSSYDSPTIVLTNKESVCVNNGDVWNPYAYIASVTDVNGGLPVITESDNVDMTTDGTYSVTYTAIGYDGSSSTAELTVVVKTPEEVLEARRKAEEERIAAEEEAKRQAEEEAARAELEAAGNGTPVYGSGTNPYYGGWSNCTWSAWELANAYTGVAMPNFGNAGAWCYNASAYGYATGTAPSAGSIAVYSNHVAYVAAVSDDGSSVYIMEGGMNGGYYERWVSAWGTGTQSLVGYIYLN